MVLTTLAEMEEYFGEELFQYYYPDHLNWHKAIYEDVHNLCKKKSSLFCICESNDMSYTSTEITFFIYRKKTLSFKSDIRKAILHSKYIHKCYGLSVLLLNILFDYLLINEEPYFSINSFPLITTQVFQFNDQASALLDSLPDEQVSLIAKGWYRKIESEISFYYSPFREDYLINDFTIEDKEYEYDISQIDEAFLEETLLNIKELIKTCKSNESIFFSFEN